MDIALFSGAALLAGTALAGVASLALRAMRNWRAAPSAPCIDPLREPEDPDGARGTDT